MMYKNGETVRFAVQFLDVTGAALTGAAVSVNIFNAAGTLLVSSGVATESAGGRYYYDYAVDSVGDWCADFQTADVDADVLNLACLRRVVANDYFDTIVSLTPVLDGLVAIQERTDNLPDDPASEATVNARASEMIEDIYNLTHTEEGESIPVVIPPPASSDSCVIYALCYDTTSKLPLLSVTATAKIVSLPYYKDGKYHEGDTIPGTYANGVCSWDIVWGATITVSIREISVLGRGTVPNSASADIHTFVS